MCCDNIHPAVCLQLICEGIYFLHSRIKRHCVRFFPVFVGYLVGKVFRKSYLALFFLFRNGLFYPFTDFGNHLSSRFASGCRNIRILGYRLTCRDRNHILIICF
jgi:hypothetical protein